jgi:protein TonB
MQAHLSMPLRSLIEGVGDVALGFDIAGPETPGIAGDGPLVFELGELDAAPRPLVRTEPLYPPDARMKGIEGSVELEFVVTADGTVAEPRVVRAQPQGVFEDAAMAAARRWRFVPGQKRGAPVATRVRQSIRFKMRER